MGRNKRDVKSYRRYLKRVNISSQRAEVATVRKEQAAKQAQGI